MLHKIIFPFFLLFLSVSYSQTDTVSIMSYNLLNYPDGSSVCGSNTAVPNRFDTLRKIIRYSQPDIFVACEIQNKKGADSILNRSLNVFGTINYSAATYHTNSGSPGLQNMLYYNSDKLILLSQDVILTSVRDIDHYILYCNDPNLAVYFDTTFIEIYMCHLKAGSSSSSQATRNSQTVLLRDFIDARPQDRNHFVCGDLNVYRSNEACYQTLISGGTNPMKDPISTPGNWNNNSSYSAIHTQSTRTSGGLDCGASGGCDDRFDQILFSNNLFSGADNIKYISGSYDAVGNDGNHYNSNLLSNPTNTQYPDSVVNALYYMSDHLPVLLKTLVTYPTSNGLALNPSQTSVSCFGGNNGSATVQPNAGQSPYTYLWGANTGNQTTQSITNLATGTYCVTVTDNLGEVDDICVYVPSPAGMQTTPFFTAETDNCNGSAAVLVSGGQSPYSYSWNDPMNQATANATNLCHGNYTVTITDDNGCSTSVDVTIQDNTSSLEDLSLHSFIISPNPFQKEIKIKIEENVGEIELHLKNVLGNEVLSSKIVVSIIGQEFVLPLENLPKGVYFLTFTVENQTFTKRIIKN